MNKLFAYLKSVSDRDTWLGVAFFCVMAGLVCISVQLIVIIEILNAILKGK